MHRAWQAYCFACGALVHNATVQRAVGGALVLPPSARQHPTVFGCDAGWAGAAAGSLGCAPMSVYSGPADYGQMVCGQQEEPIDDNQVRPHWSPGSSAESNPSSSATGSVAVGRALQPAGQWIVDKKCLAALLVSHCMPT